MNSYNDEDLYSSSISDDDDFIMRDVILNVDVEEKETVYSFGRLKTASSIRTNEEKEEMEKQQRTGYVQWNSNGNNIFTPNQNTIPTIPNGNYVVGYDNKLGYFLSKIQVFTDDLINLPIPIIKEALAEIEEFWQIKHKYEQFGFIYKRGILFHGPQGTGKTCIIQQISENIINKHNGIVVYIENMDDMTNFNNFFPTIFRKIEPNRPIVVVIEDIDQLAESDRSTNILLNLLDGPKQIKNVVYLATTNHAEKLHERIINRPSRFDRKHYIGFPDREIRKEYLKYYFKDQINEINLDEWLDKTNDYSLAHLKEIIISTQIYGKSLDESIAIIDRIKKGVKDISMEMGKIKQTIGFKKNE